MAMINRTQITATRLNLGTAAPSSSPGDGSNNHRWAKVPLRDRNEASYFGCR